MSVLLELCRCVEVGRELINISKECKILNAQTEKIARKVKRGELVIEDLKKNFNESEVTTTPRLNIVVKNYLSILASCLEFVTALNNKYAITNMLNSESHKKALYSILNDIEQAIFELDTEACLIERAAFEKHKKVIQAKLDEDNILDSVVKQDTNKEETKPMDLTNENKEKEQLHQKLDTTIQTSNPIPPETPKVSNLEQNNNQSIAAPLPQVKPLNCNLPVNPNTYQNQSNQSNQSNQIQTGQVDITQSIPLSHLKTEWKEQIAPTQGNTQSSKIQNINNQVETSSQLPPNLNKVNMNYNTINITQQSTDGPLQQISNRMQNMSLEVNKDPSRMLTEEFKGFLSTHYIPGSQLITQKNSERNYRYYKSKKKLIYFTSYSELVEEKNYINGVKEHLKMILREITNLHELQGSPYIVRLFGITDSSEGLPLYYPHSILVETTEHGSLLDLVKSGIIKTQEFKLNLLEDVAHGLVYLHNTRGFLHCNLNPNNILINSQGRAKITGFEFAVNINKSKDYKLPNFYENGIFPMDVLIWLDPFKVLNPDSIYTYSTDTFAYSMLFWILFAMRLPYQNMSSEQLIQFYKQGKRETKDLIPVQFHRLLDLCWDSNPELRPKAQDILSLLNEPVHVILPDQQFHLQPNYQAPPSPSNFFISPYHSPPNQTIPNLPPAFINPMINNNFSHGFSMPQVTIPPNNNFNMPYLTPQFPNIPTMSTNPNSFPLPPPTPPRRNDTYSSQPSLPPRRKS